jgi:anti-sigma factor RsiW
MADRAMLADHKIQDYIDGRLSERDQAAVAAYLLVHPDVAAEVEMLRRQNEALRGIGHEILDEPVPARLRTVLYRHVEQPAEVVGLRGGNSPRSFRFLEAAAAILLFCAGGAFGWFLHDRLTFPPAAQDLIASNAADLYRFYGGEHQYPVDFPPDRTAELASWIQRSFDRDISPPDLATLSYEYRGGEVRRVAGANIGFFQFESPAGARLAVVFWPGEQPPTRLQNIGGQQNVAARYWLGSGISFAVMSDESNPDLEPAAQAVFSFYGGGLASNGP